MENFTFFLNFISLGHPNTYQISEPVGFDSANFIIKQNNSRYSRDIIYGNDELDLTFEEGSYELSDNDQVHDVFGNYSQYLEMGLKWILETKKQFGFNGKIEFILKKDGLTFSVGLLDLGKNFKTDNLTYFSCKIIQVNSISDYKKHDSTNIDVFGIKNIKNETISPANTLSFLRKATTTFLESEWNCPNLYDENHNAFGTRFDATKFYYFNNCQNVIKSDIKNTIPLFAQTYSIQEQVLDENVAQKDFLILKSKFTNTDLQLNFSNVIVNIETDTDNGGDGYCDGKMVVKWGYENQTPIGEENPISWFLEDGAQPYQSTDPNFTVNIPYLPIGASVWVYFRNKVRQSTNFTVGLTPRFEAFTKISQYTLKVSTNSTGLNTVLKGVRYIDMMKQCSKNINQSTIIKATKFDIGGRFYDQVCFNRNLISQRIDRPFNTNFKDILGSVIEVNGDYEVKENEIFVGQMDDYYVNQEIGVFKEIPSKEYLNYWNPRFLLNKLKFGWKIFEQNRNSKYTSQDIHTNSEWIIPNDGVENVKDISLELIRSNYSQQAIVDLETSQPQTSDENDDKVYITDIIQLPANSQNSFSTRLLMYPENGKLFLLNRALEDSEDDVAINWNTQGITIGQDFRLDNCDNFGDYTVESFDRVKLVLIPNAGTNPTFSGDTPVMISFNYQNIIWQNRTKEEMDIIGIGNPETYGNLLHTIRRNMIEWESYLNTACSFVRSGVIRNSFFKNNPNVTTQLTSETVALSEKSDITVPSLKPRILNSEMHEITVFADFKMVLDVVSSQSIIRGFVRCLGINGNIIKGFIQKLDYTWATGELKLILEGKFDTDLLVLSFSDSVLTVNDVVYELNGNINWWVVTNEYFQAFDKNNIAICNPYRFNFVSLNGTVFATPNELTQTLKNL